MKVATLLLWVQSVTVVVVAVNTPWTATSGTDLVVTVDGTNFVPYSVTVKGEEWGSSGDVGVVCNQRRYSATAGNLTGGAVTTINGTDPTLGTFTAIQRTWTPMDAEVGCSPITTSVKW